ncbi:hypothetical protein PHYBLDRAFT_153016 [Phycomyces blakesleeanus NRRL 1555(-)]|uniref:Uncharacterized protein n=1 Tax=Phycomyces blakesleeanus (strain ATCC 8743b / DSM 1359 / FGSC 10004 / NBRC 33097 / NRRL 1555) TaxID=763407 RepID=A0A167JHD3_PHYB8|nr:hypothetical protein PHYBLDRAFT_153016 [Phycomyces blakesleeanus NRRL 1555(-)]OAD65986.1 hypothetical protein PHYBLDRAFT_153016 [Phycomyces blakesleeanus NRRL 1555(-)]|eukprot:XP_018284026.1 hypothetical protein PHYBLDRAFT_153016 [Phycomyces blakesleeanus NRRL 1555(-)]
MFFDDRAEWTLTTNSKQPSFQQKQCANLQRWGQPQKGLTTEWQRSYQILAYHTKNPKYIQAYNAMYNISKGETVQLAYRAALPFEIQRQKQPLKNCLIACFVVHIDFALSSVVYYWRPLIVPTGVLGP